MVYFQISVFNKNNLISILNQNNEFLLFIVKIIFKPAK